jgi:hypothetical protein
MGRRIHVITTYYDGLQRFLPYMRLWAKDDSGNVFTDKQGYSFQGVTKLIMPGPGVGGNIAEIAPPVSGETPVLTPGAVAISEATVTSSTYVHTLAAGQWLMGWELRSSVAQEVSVGTTAGGSELGGPVALSALQWWVGQGNDVPSEGGINIHFTGLSGTNTIKIWLATA